MDTTIIIAILSVFIAACALGVTLWQGWQNRKHNRLSVLPYLIIEENSNTEDNTKRTVTNICNRGVGPAIIKNFLLLYDGEVVAHNNMKDYQDFLTKKLKELGFINISTGSHIPNSALGVGESSLLGAVKYNVKNIDESVLERLGERLDIVIEYCSIYKDEIFVCSSRKKESEQCPPPPKN